MALRISSNILSPIVQDGLRFIFRLDRKFNISSSINRDLEPDKWVKIKGWADIKVAKEELENGVKNFQQHS